MQPRDYQAEGVDSIFKYFATGARGNPLLVYPTGTGKSLIIAFFIKKVLEYYPTQRIIILTHVKELIQQNASKVVAVAPNIPVGIYSAGLKSRDTMMPVIFGGIASVNKKTQLFGHRDLISNKSNTMYNKVIEDFKKINPFMKVIGLTATPFRLGQGMLTDGGIFTDICINYSAPEKFNWFIEKGYLAPLIPKKTSVEIDTSEVSIHGGEFVQSQLQKAADKEEITKRAVSEMCKLGHDRKCWLIFSSGLEHSEHIAEELNTAGVPTTVIHSKLTNKERDLRLKQHEDGIFRAIVNYGVLTTGYDNPRIDLIGMLRATQSPGLWVQMLGRGTRPCDGKKDCLVLDFAANAVRLGPINDPVTPVKRGGSGTGDPPIKICEECGTYNHPTTRICICCGFEFKFLPKIKQTASSAELIRDTTPKYKSYEIKNVRYVKHTKRSNGNLSMKVIYYCGPMALDTFMEFVSPEHSNNFVARKAREWWRQRHIEDPPDTVDQYVVKAPELVVPKKLKVHINKKPHPEIVGYEF